MARAHLCFLGFSPSSFLSVWSRKDEATSEGMEEVSAGLEWWLVEVLDMAAHG